MDRKELKKLLVEQASKKPKEGLVDRELFSKINRESGFVIIISGIRRCGKSTLLEQLMNGLGGYYVNFDDERLINFTVDDFQVMMDLLIELFGEKKHFFFDEIQNIHGWERFVRRLHDNGEKVFITGSNASMLSRELGTHLTGRNISYSLYPFSFKEFLLFRGRNFDEHLTSKDESMLRRMFNEYLSNGGFPEFLRSGEKEYLKNAYENIIYRDIITRYKLPNEKIIKEVVKYTASNLGKEISFNQLRKLTGLSSATTIKEYFGYLENSYVTFLVPRYDPSLKKQIYFNKKAYFIDLGMASLLGFRSSSDYGRMLENVVFLELKRKGKELYFHKGGQECDFLLREGIKIVEALQVTQDPSKERELTGLMEAMNTHKLKQGLILTLDEEDSFSKEGKKIILKPIWKWLLGL